MELYLVRHAEALDAAPGMTDEERPLSSEGREKMGRGARGLGLLLAGREPLLDAVLSSPLRRAMETARILARVLLGREEVVDCPPLAADLEWSDLLPHLRAYPALARLALVGHEPSLGELAGSLLGGGAEAGVPLKKGSVMAFELEAFESPPRATLLWLLTSRQLRMLR